MPNAKLTRKELDAIPDKYLATIVNILMGSENDTIPDLLTPQIRPSVENIYPIFVIMYVLLAVVGTLMNCGMIYHIIRDKLYRDPTYAYLINIAISDVIKCVFVLPITLAVLLIQNWIFGKFMCYFLPMLQDIPIHVSMMTYVLIAGDRYRLISDPGKPRIPENYIADISIHVSMMTYVLIAGDKYRLISDPGKPRIPENYIADIPIHVSMMTYVLIAGDRYRLISDPGKPRIPENYIADIPIHVSMMTYVLIAGDRYRVISDPGRPRIPENYIADIPIHVSMMTYVLIAGDRYRVISDPGRPRIPAFVCALGSWFFAVCIVLPHPIYTTYLDLEIYRKEHFRGVGICVMNLTDDIQQYMRGLFLLTYIAPLTITAYAYVKSSRELQTQEGPLALAMYEARNKDSHSRHGSSVSTGVTSIRDGIRESDTAGTSGLSTTLRTYDLYDAELDVCKEKRTQKYLISMVSVFAVLFCPLMVLKLAKLALVETYENMGPFDITFTLFVWLAFSSTVTTPVFYTSWQMSRLTKARLRGYFWIRNHNLTEEPEAMPDLTDNHVSRDNASVTNVAYAQNVRAESLIESCGIVKIPRAVLRS